jgi:hypothetical protein
MIVKSMLVQVDEVFSVHFESLFTGKDGNFDATAFTEAEDVKRIATSLHVTSRHLSDLLVNAILEWKAGKKVSANRYLKSEPVSQAMQAWVASRRFSSVDLAAAHANTLYFLLVDTLFCHCVLTSIENQQKENALLDVISVQLESICFDALKHEEKVFLANAGDAITQQNRTWVLDRYGCILGVLSMHRFQSVAKRYLHEINLRMDSTANRSGAVIFAKAMKFLRFDLTKTSSIASSAAFLVDLEPVLQQSKIIELKHAFCDSLTFMFAPFVSYDDEEDPSSLSETVDSKPFLDALSLLFAKLQFWNRKSKHYVATFPAITAVICAHNHDFFDTHAMSFLEGMLYKNLKDMRLRLTCVLCIYRLTQVYLRKYAVGTAETATYLQNVTSSIFASVLSNGRAQLQPSDVVLDAVVELICLIYSYRPEIAVSCIIELFNSRNIVSAEHVVIGLRALLFICSKDGGHLPGGKEDKRGDIDSVSSRSSLPKATHAHDQTTIATDAFLLRPLSSLPVNLALVELPPAFEEHAGVLRDQINAIFSYYDHQCGHVLLHASKPSVMPPELSIDGLRSTMQCLPGVLNESMLPRHLVSILCRLTTHIDSGIRQEAFLCLNRLVRDVPIFCAPIMHGYAEFLLRLTRNAEHAELRFLGIRQCIALMKQWIESLSGKEASLLPPQRKDKGAKAGSLEDFNACRVEVLGLICICSSSAEERALGLEVLSVTRALDGAVTEEELQESRVLDVVEEMWRTIITAAYLEPSSMPELGNHQELLIPPTISIHALAQAASPADQGRWTRCLAEIVRHCLEFCREIVTLLWKEGTQYVYGGRPTLEVGSKAGPHPGGGNGEKSADLIFWRNCAVISAVAVGGISEQAISAQSKHVSTGNVSAITQNFEMNSRPQNASELLRLILPYLKSNSAAVRSSAVMAVGKIHPACWDTLMLELAPYMSEVFVDREKLKTKKAKDQLRREIAWIMLVVCRAMLKERIAISTVFKDKLVGYFKENMSYLEIPVNSFLWELQNFRLILFLALRQSIEYGLAFHVAVLSSKEWRHRAFVFLSIWSGHGPGSQKRKAEEVEIQRQLLDRVKDDVDRNSLMRSFAAQTFSLELCAVQTMAVTLSGSSWMSDGKCTLAADDLVKDWIKHVLSSPVSLIREAGQRGVTNILISCPDAVPLCVDNSFIHGSGENRSGSSYFLAFCDAFARTEIHCDVHVVLNVILFKLCDSLKVVRAAAIKLLQLLVSRYFEQAVEEASYHVSVTSHVVDSCMQVQEYLSSRLASDHRNLSVPFVLEVFRTIRLVDEFNKRRMMEYLLPWVRNFDLIGVCWTAEELSGIGQCLVTLVAITHEFGESSVSEVQKIWMGLSAKEGNVFPLLHFILEYSVHGHSHTRAEFRSRVNTLKKIVLCVARNFPALVLSLLCDTMREFWAPHKKRRETASFSTERMHFGNRELNRHVEEFDEQSSAVFTRERNPTSRLNAQNASPDETSLTDISATSATTSQLNKSARSRQPISSQRIAPMLKHEISLICVVEVAYEQDEVLRPHLPLLLHAAFVAMDHPSSMLHNHAKALLINLVQSVVLKQLGVLSGSVEDTEDHEKALEVIELLGRKDGPMWALEDISLEDPQVESSGEVASLVRRILQVMSSESGLSERWGGEALRWATTSPSLHISCRSYQIYRTLCPSVTVEASVEILGSLSLFMEDPVPAHLGVAMEVLETLMFIVDRLSGSKLILFPQVFWASVALLHSEFVHLFNAVMGLLMKLIDRMDIASTAAQNVLFASLPSDWNPPFYGLQPLVLKGLLSPITEERSHLLIAKLLSVNLDRLVDPSPSRLALAITGLLPWIMQQIGTDPVQLPPMLEVRQAAEAMARACEKEGYIKLSRLFLRLAQGSVDGPEAFLHDLRRPFADAFFPAHAGEVVSLLMDITRTGGPHYRNPTLQILHGFMLHLDFASPTLVDHLSHLLPFLVRLTRTGYWEDATRVLDVACHRAVPGEHDHSVITLARLASNEDSLSLMRKEEESKAEKVGFLSVSGSTSLVDWERIEEQKQLNPEHHSQSTVHIVRALGRVLDSWAGEGGLEGGGGGGGVAGRAPSRPPLTTTLWEEHSNLSDEDEDRDSSMVTAHYADAMETEEKLREFFRQAADGRETTGPHSRDSNKDVSLLDVHLAPVNDAVEPSDGGALRGFIESRQELLRQERESEN